MSSGYPDRRADRKIDVDIPVGGVNGKSRIACRSPRFIVAKQFPLMAN
jgi:hypothetical protein